FSGPGSIVYAKRSEGTWTIPMLGSTDAPRQLRVSDESNIANARSLRSFESGHTNVGLIEQFTQTLQITAEPVRMDSQAKYAIMAAGGGELLLRLISPNQPEYKEKIWDQAAGSLIVEEAGGRITDLNGSRLDFSHGRKLVNNRGVLVSNGILHQEALTILKQINA
ncbi:MAG: hypothetical protein JW750_02115, partial [Anaerolineaceae bacterium]|nr:hypothetical protein [Anaerolineaceae bacterium]